MTLNAATYSGRRRNIGHRRSDKDRNALAESRRNDGRIGVEPAAVNMSPVLLAARAAGRSKFAYRQPKRHTCQPATATGTWLLMMR